MGLSCAKVTIYQDNVKVASTITNCCGIYYLKVPKSMNYIISVFKKEKKQCKKVKYYNSNFCLLNFIFNDSDL